MPENNNDRPSIPSLFSDLLSELTTLFRAEIRLARTELSEKLGQLVAGGASMAVGAAVVFGGFLTLLASAVLGLAHVLAPWLSALIVGAVVVLVGAGLLIKGRSNMRARNLAPQRSKQSLRHDKDLAASHAKG